MIIFKFYYIVRIKSNVHENIFPDVLSKFIELKNNPRYMI